ncbi:hypothetical protein EON66_10270, partial [archaeon]
MQLDTLVASFEPALGVRAWVLDISDIRLGSTAACAAPSLPTAVPMPSWWAAAVGALHRLRYSIQAQLEASPHRLGRDKDGEDGVAERHDNAFITQAGVCTHYCHIQECSASRRGATTSLELMRVQGARIQLSQPRTLQCVQEERVYGMQASLKAAMLCCGGQDVSDCVHLLALCTGTNGSSDEDGMPVASQVPAADLHATLYLTVQQLHVGAGAVIAVGLPTACSSAQASVLLDSVRISASPAMHSSEALLLQHALPCKVFMWPAAHGAPADSSQGAGDSVEHAKTQRGPLRALDVCVDARGIPPHVMSYFGGQLVATPPAHEPPHENALRLRTMAGEVVREPEFLFVHVASAPLFCDAAHVRTKLEQLGRCASGAPGQPRVHVPGPSTLRQVDRNESDATL